MYVNPRLPLVNKVIATSLVALGMVVAAAGQSPASAQTPAQAPVTFAKDIAPILQRACQDCHRPGAIAPMSLISYQDVRPWARSIKTRTEKREMPPWAIDRNVGITKFKDDPSLTDQEIAAIAKWADAGAPLGNPADMPPARAFSDLNAWRIGAPDLVVQKEKPWVVPAQAPDYWGNFTVDPKLTEDRWISAVEIKPAANSHTVVHHSGSTMLPPGTDSDDSADDEESGVFLNEYALGKNGDIFEDGTARLIKAGTKIRINGHFHSQGEEVPAIIKLGLKFYPKGWTPKHEVVTQHMGDNVDIAIPANTKDVRYDGYTILTKPAVVTSFQPHLHNRGQKECMEAIIPPTGPDGMPKLGDGTSAPLAKPVTLSCIERWDFNWHIVYNYAEDVAPVLPAGTIIHVTTWYDNTSGNKANPDPLANVARNNRTIDEMSFAWVSYYYLSDEEYKAKVAERKAQSTNNNNNQQQ